MPSAYKPLAFRLFKIRHDDGDGDLTQLIWNDFGHPGDTMRVRAIGMADGYMNSLVTYVAKGGNAQDIRRRMHQLDENIPYGDYTTAVTVDLDALGLSNVDRVRASNALYQAILEVRAELVETLPVIEPPLLGPSPKHFDNRYSQNGRTYTVTYEKGELVEGRIRCSAVRVVDDLGVEYEVADGLLRAGFVEDHCWVSA